GDRILEVDRQPVSKFMGMGDSVMWRIVRSTGETVPVTVERNGKILTFNPVPIKEETKFWQRKSLRQIRIVPAESAVIAEVAPSSPAAQSGLRRGDTVLQVNGEPIRYFGTVSEEIEQHPSDKISFLVERGRKTFEASLTPETPISPPHQKPRLGIVWDANGKT